METWTAELLDRRDRRTGATLPIRGGSLDWDIDRAVQGTGKIEVDGASDVDWLQTRVMIWHDDGRKRRPFGIWIPTIGGWNYTSTGRTAEVDLADKGSILARQTGRWTAIFPDKPVVQQVLDHLQSIGEQAIIPDSGLTNPMAQVYQPTATWAEVTTTALAAVGMGPITAGLDGVLSSDVARGWSNMPVAGVYGAEPGDLLMTPEYTDDTTALDVPNVYVVASPASDKAPAYLGIYRNENSSDPYSVPNRGEVVHVEELQVISQAMADAAAEAGWQRAASRGRTISWTHPVDDTAAGQVVRFRPLETRVAITQRQVELGIGAVVKSTGREVRI